MAYAMFGFTNLVSTGALTVNTAAAGLDGSQLQNDQGSASMAWQTTGTSGTLTIDSGSTGTAWRAFVLARTNLTTAATVRWRVSNSATFATSVYDSGTVSAGIVAGFGQSVLTAAADQTGQYCRVDITDSGNPEAFLNVPLAYAGPVWIPLTNISWSTVFGRDDQTDEVVSRGGQEFPVGQFVRRRWDVDMQGIRSTEVWPQAMALDAVGRSGTNVLFIPDPSSATLAREALFGRLKSLADLSYPFGSGDRRAWKARITERL